MKLVSYSAENKEFTGLFVDGQIYSLSENSKALSFPELPQLMLEFLQGGKAFMKIAREIENAIRKGNPAVIAAKINEAESVGSRSPSPKLP